MVRHDLNAYYETTVWGSYTESLCEKILGLRMACRKWRRAGMFFAGVAFLEGAAIIWLLFWK